MTHEENSGTVYGGNRLHRSRYDRIFGGVCAGIAEQLGVDALLVRVVAVALALVTGGTAVIAYLIAWALLTKAGTGRSCAREGAPSGDSAVRDSWTAAGGEWRSLAAQLRRPRPVSVLDTDVARQKRRLATPLLAVLAILLGRPPVHRAVATPTLEKTDPREPLSAVPETFWS